MFVNHLQAGCISFSFDLQKHDVSYYHITTIKCDIELFPSVETNWQAAQTHVHSGLPGTETILQVQLGWSYSQAFQVV